MKRATIKHWQKKIFILCWTSYACAYLCRLNISVAIPVLEENRVLAKTALGMAGGLFFWFYAFGQLINGRLGDRFDGRKFIFLGLFASAIANILFGISAGFFIMHVLWALNGYFQSILFGPLMKMLVNWFPANKRSKTSLGVFSAAIAGNILSWGVLGQVVSFTGWRSIFLIPGLITLIYSFIWYTNVKNRPDEIGFTIEENKQINIEEDRQVTIEEDKPVNIDKEKQITVNQDRQISIDGNKHDTIEKDKRATKTNNQISTKESFIKTIFGTDLWLIALSGIPLGLVREGINVWGPTLLYESFHLDIQSTLSMVVMIPCLNFLGVMAARYLIGLFPKDEKKVVSILFIFGVTACIFLYLLKTTSVIVYLLLLCCCSSSLYGATSVITSVIPLNYRLTSSTVGFLDFTIYLGAGVSGILTGFVSENFGWNAVTLLWTIAGIAGTVFIIMSKKKRNG